MCVLVCQLWSEAEADDHSYSHPQTVVRIGMWIMLCTYDFMAPASARACHEFTIRADGPSGELLRQLRPIQSAPTIGENKMIYD